MSHYSKHNLFRILITSNKRIEFKYNTFITSSKFPLKSSIIFFVKLLNLRNLRNLKYKILISPISDYLHFKTKNKHKNLWKRMEN